MYFSWDIIGFYALEKDDLMYIEYEKFFDEFYNSFLQVNIWSAIWGFAIGTILYFIGFVVFKAFHLSTTD